MLKRKIEEIIRNHFKNIPNKILLIDGARQVGKSYIIRYVGKDMFENYVEINMLDDFNGDKIFEKPRSINDFYLQLSAIAGEKLDKKENTLVFIDEIQTYPYLLTLLKFLNLDNKYTFVTSGSLLGVTLEETNSIPMGSVERVQMYPLDFEEFLWANHVGEDVISFMHDKFIKNESLDDSIHQTIMKHFKNYLLIGGMPEVVSSFVEDFNIVRIRNLQSEIHNYYSIDASKYDKERKLKIRRIYDMIPSNMENKKKRVVVKKIEDKKGKRYSDYEDEFEYLITSCISLSVQALSNPRFPLIETAEKNLMKLYLNDVGLLTNIFYGRNINAVLEDDNSINLGSVYETVVASELKAHGYNLFYYDNKQYGEVDYLIDDYDNLSALPLEVKSGKDYREHSALNRLLNVKDYNIKKAYVLSNEQEVRVEDKIIYIPIYYIMFLKNK